MNDKSQVETILNDIKSMVDNVIIKLSYQAEQYETVNIKREAERYITAYMERDNFNSYRSYPMDVLAKAGISNLNDLATYSNDRHSIPHDKRKAVVKAMRETVIKEYVEMNDYYRELIGLPSTKTPESEFIYLTEEEMKFYNIDEARPIHEYPKEIQYKLERELIPQLIELYPERTYLKHMGSKSVNLVRAREARNFEIIFTDINLDSVFMRAFFETYDFAREYFMNMLYNKGLRDRYDLYDNFIGMHIMIMTIQRLVVDTIKMGIDRDFYDLISIKKLFNVYGVPFFEDLPLDYQRTIVKNVNMLIRSKSTDKVLYDIANTLFYERVKIYKYYLVKQRKFDEYGEPIFLYKEKILDSSAEKYYIMSSNKKTYAFAIYRGKLATIEEAVSYAPDSIYTKDVITGETIRIFMLDDRLYSEPVETNGQIITEVVMYDGNGNKYVLGVEKNRLTTEQMPLNKVVVYDYENMFDVYFQAVDILEKNVISSLETKYNRYSYEEVTSDDVYWWETEELKQELYEREYNYIDTKYLSITVMQNVTKMLYETSYYLNMLVDHKNTNTTIESRIFNSDNMKLGTDYLYVTLDRFSSVPISIFDAVMTICALIAKKNGMKGNIIVESPSKILSVLGFNFEANFDLIRENIKKYKRVFKNQEILKYLDLLDIRTVKDIDTLFNNFRNFSEFCADVIATTTDINEYRAYKELYKVITVRKDSVELFKLTNGEVASTYLEYLYDKVPNIAKIIDEMHKDKTGIYIEHVIGKLNELIPEIEYLNTLNGTNNNIVQAIQGLVNFFKSYTVDLRTLNILYMFDNKTLNKIYMIDDPRLFITLYGNDLFPTYSDNLQPIVAFDKNDNLVIYDPEKTKIQLNPVEYIESFNEIEQLITKLKIDDILQLDYKDVMEMYAEFTNQDIIDLRDFKNIESRLHLKEEFIDLKHIIILKFLLMVMDKLELDYKDIIKEIPVNMTILHDLKIKIKNVMYNHVYQDDKYFVRDSCATNICQNIFNSLEFNYKDIIKELINLIQPSINLQIYDKVKIIYED